MPSEISSVQPKIRSARPRYRGLLRFLARFGVSVLLVWLLFKSVPVLEALDLFKPKVIPFIAASLLMYLVAQALCALKWKIIAESLLPGIRYGLGLYVILYYIGMFFSMFLPTTVGGDVARVWYFTARTAKLKESAASVFLERATGGFGLLSVLGVAYLLTDTEVLASLPWVGGFLQNKAMAVLVGLLGVVGVLVFGLLGKRLRWLEGMPSALAPLLWAYAFSLVFYAGFGFAHYLLGVGLGLHVGFLYYVFFVALVSLVSMLPVTVSGIGLREGGYVLCLRAAGVPLKSATAFSLLWLLVLLLGASIGGVLYLVGLGRTEDGRIESGLRRR